MIRITSKGSFKKTERKLLGMSKVDILGVLNRYGQMGVNALASATPVESGLTAESWSYEVSKRGRGYSIMWSNGHVVNGVPVVILLQYGHGTGTGGYVQGRDFINPAIRPIFEKIKSEVWKAVTSA